MDMPAFYERLFRSLARVRLLNPFFIAYFFVTFYMKYKLRNALTVTWARMLRWGQPVIMIGNHSSKHDFYLMAGVAARFGRLVRGLVSESDWKDPVQSIQLRYLKMVPRMGTGEEIVDRMVRALDEGCILAIAPEGTFSKGLVIEPFTGFLRVYFKANANGYRVPLVPCFAKGIAQAYPRKDNYFTRRGDTRKVKITSIIGAPFHLPIPDSFDRDTLRHYANAVMRKVARLGGQKHLWPNPALERRRKEAGSDERYYDVIDGVDLE